MAHGGRWLSPSLFGLIAAWPLAAVIGVCSPQAQTAGTIAPVDKPFADHRLVLQLSDDDAKKQSLVISVAYNLLKFYGPDKIAIEVVTFGPGIALLRADSPNRKYVDSLMAQGVQFDLCMNTVDTIKRETGHVPPFNPNARPVEAGVAQILALTEKGYTLVRP